MKRKIILSIFLLSIAHILYAQNEFTTDTRAQYIFDLSKYIQWPENLKTQGFDIGIIADSALFKSLEKLVVGKTKNDKPYKILLFKNAQEIKPTHIIYNNKNTGIELDSVYYYTSSYPTLLISENYEFHKSMINFIVVNNLCRFELHEEKISEKGITIPHLLAAQAIKTKVEWEELYNETEELLEIEKEVVKTQNIKILEQLAQIEIQEKEIDSQKVEIDNQTKFIILQKDQIQNQKKELFTLAKDISSKQKQLDKSIQTLNKQEKEIEIQKEDIKKQQTTLIHQSQDIAKKEELLIEQEGKLNSLLAQLKLQRIVLILSVILLGVFIFLGYFIYRAYKIKKMSNIVLQAKNKEILAQKEEIETQRDILAKQKQEITDSIHYASRIQAAVLPPKEFINKILPENYFILYKPRDIVSGDFFWITQKGNKTIITVADCTGHGVPGAFMSMLGISFLNEIVNANNVIDANEILNELRDHVIKALHQTGETGENKDGMDIALCVIDFDTNKLHFSGAYNPLYMVRNNELLHFKADKMPIGIFFKGNQPFTNQEIDIEKGDTFYVFSDGYVDQFGGDNNSKFKSKQFKQLLIDIQKETMANQKNILDKTIEEWKGKNDQIDDILVMGIKL
jgi:serine phosphatase RsbU (regulator of sigma subunit)